MESLCISLMPRLLAHATLNCSSSAFIILIFSCFFFLALARVGSLFRDCTKTQLRFFHFECQCTGLESYFVADKKLTCACNHFCVLKGSTQTKLIIAQALNGPDVALYSIPAHKGSSEHLSRKVILVFCRSNISNTLHSKVIGEGKKLNTWYHSTVLAPTLTKYPDDVELQSVKAGELNPWKMSFLFMLRAVVFQTISIAAQTLKTRHRYTSGDDVCAQLQLDEIKKKRWLLASTIAVTLGNRIVVVPLVWLKLQLFPCEVRSRFDSPYDRVRAEALKIFFSSRWYVRHMYMQFNNNNVSRRVENFLMHPVHVWNKFRFDGWQAHLSDNSEKKANQFSVVGEVKTEAKQSAHGLETRPLPVTELSVQCKARNRFLDRFGFREINAGSWPIA